MALKRCCVFLYVLIDLLEEVPHIDGRALCGNGCTLMGYPIENCGLGVGAGSGVYVLTEQPGEARKARSAVGCHLI